MNLNRAKLWRRWAQWHKTSTFHSTWLSEITSKKKKRIFQHFGHNIHQQGRCSRVVKGGNWEVAQKTADYVGSQQMIIFVRDSATSHVQETAATQHGRKPPDDDLRWYLSAKSLIILEVWLKTRGSKCVCVWCDWDGGRGVWVGWM